MALEPAPLCGDCGVLIGDVELHTAWHAGGTDTGTQAAIVEFLASVDPDALEQAMAAQALRMTTGQAALAVLTQLAEQT